MPNYYFSYFMKEYGEDNFQNLINKILSTANIREEIKKFSLSGDWQFLYFFAVFYIITLNYFKLDIKQISICLDIVIAPGTSSLINPSEILKKQKNIIPEIENYIKKELKNYDS